MTGAGLLRNEDAARYLTVSESTFNRLVRAGSIPKTRISAGVVRFRIVDLDAHIAAISRRDIALTPWPERRRRRPGR